MLPSLENEEDLEEATNGYDDNIHSDSEDLNSDGHGAIATKI